MLAASIRADSAWSCEGLLIPRALNAQKAAAREENTADM